jgi:hypothetical protein
MSKQKESSTVTPTEGTPFITYLFFSALQINVIKISSKIKCEGTQASKAKPEAPVEHRAPPRVVTFFLYSPDDVAGPVGIRTDVDDLGGWDTTLFIMERKGPHLWVGTIVLPEGLAKKQNNVVMYYKYPFPQSKNQRPSPAPSPPLTHTCNTPTPPPTHFS